MGILLGGLSQGAALALDLMLHAPGHLHRICGCFCTRGMMQRESKWSLDQQIVDLRSRTCPVFVYHGRSDNVVPWSCARASYNCLKELGFHVSICAERDMSHADESIKEYSRVAQFVAQIFLHN